VVSSELAESMAGPLDRYLDGFRRFLIDQERYRRKPALKLVGLMRDLSWWMAASEVGIDVLTEIRAEEFTRARKRAGRSWLLSSRALIQVFCYLRGIGAVPAPVVAEPGAAGRLLACFADYLAGERGLARGTIRQYLAAARLFIDGGLPGEPDLGQVTAAQVSEFVRVRCAGRSPAAAGDLTCGLRSFLRFAHATGLASADLSAAVPSRASRADVFLPRGVERATLAALLGSCDRGCQVGRRDYAILMVLTRLGLRAGEVAALSLDDVNWRAGVVVVRGKGKAVDTLPLPVDVGDALASYLSWEGLHRKTRTVFVRARAPHGSLAPSSVSMIVYRACRRAGVAEIGAHRLRHSLATEMLKQGASLSEVAQALRHRSIVTTARYARAGRVALRQVAAPWPAVAGRPPRPARSPGLGTVARPWPGSQA